MISVEALPADDGDCLWVEWTAPDGIHRMLVDGGRYPAGLMDRLRRQRPDEQLVFDVVMCTHIDIDHIGGLLPLFRRPPPGFVAKDMWFNGPHHLREDGLGPDQGDQLTELLVAARQPWNVAFGKRAVVVPSSGSLSTVRLPGLEVTLLSPGRDRLERLLRKWPEVVQEEVALVPKRPPDTLGDRNTPLVELAAAPYKPDSSVANGSSIAVLLTDDDGSTVLLGADAHAEVLVTALRRLKPAGRIPVTLCKLPHHASAYNVSPALLATLDCRDWLVSTSGARHGHPDRAAIARILDRRDRSTLWFNYRVESTEEFAKPSLALRWGCTTVHPDAGRPGIRLEVAGGQVRRG